MRKPGRWGHRRTIRDSLLGAVVLIGAFLALAVSLQFLARVDSDRYYHFAISRLTVERGLLRELAQPSDLSWGRYFPDKDFLFHQLTALAYRLGGEAGTVAAILAVAALALLGVYVSALRRLPALESVAVTAAFTLFCPVFVNRFILLRPHVLAIFWMVLLVHALIRRSRALALAAGSLFALSYAAVYLPSLILIAALFFSLFVDKRPELSRACGYGFAGLVVGLLINPYFPSNIGMVTSTFHMALESRLAPANNGGQEMVPYPTLMFLEVFSFPLLLVLGSGAWWLTRKRETNKGDRIDHGWLLVSTAGFWCLTSITPRGVEYAFPLTALLAAVTVSRLEKKREAAVAILALACLLEAPFWYLLQKNAHEDYRDPAPGIFSKLDQIPRSSGGRKIFNCEWDLGAYILYRRPDLAFVDFLDPMLLQDTMLEKFRIRQALLAGAIPKATKALRDVFKADYVLCRAPALNRELLSSKDASLLAGPGPGSAPGSSDALLHLFRIEKKDPAGSLSRASGADVID